YKIDDKWSLYGGPSVGFSAEDGADLRTSFTFGGLVGFNYRVNPKLTIGLGIGVFSQIEDDAKVLPVPTVEWSFADKGELHVGYHEIAANPGLGLELGYHIVEDWTVGLGVQYERRRFRLSE